MDNGMGKVVDILKTIYNEYENKYSEIIYKLKIETKIWSKSLHNNLYPLEIELTGNKCGKLYKSEPEIKKNVVVYGFMDNKLDLFNNPLNVSSVIVYESANQSHP